jgi:nanoRNase/pAp phosphatase (c-di-AMP/oligoRNAs hydrolase)
MAITRTIKVSQFYAQFSNEDHVLILIAADPDAIASAMAIRRLLWRKTASVTVSPINVVKRTDNLAMIKLLNIKLVPQNQLDMQRFTRVVIVDSQPTHHEAFTKTKLQVVIDHHPETEFEADYKDIRPDYGATASILTEYLLAARIKISTRLATALFYAIKTDTGNFERKTTIEDLRAFQFLFKRANIYLVQKIEQSEIKPSFLKFFQNAIENRKQRKDWIFANLGAVPSPDVCVMIADFLMRIDCVNWSVIAGTNAGKLIVIFRSSGYRRNCGKIAGQSFGRIGSAGGHKSMARAEIALSDLKDLVDYKNDRKVLNWIIKQIGRH